MVQRTVWYDDLALQQDEEVPASVRDFTFTFEGQEYTIDLTHENADKLRAIFAPYKDAARRADRNGVVVSIPRRTRRTAPAATTAPAAPAPAPAPAPAAPVLAAAPEPEPEPVTIPATVPVFSAPAAVPADEPPLSPGAAALRAQRGGATPAEIRAWAAKVGLTVSVRGRIAAAAAEAYMHRDPETDEPSASDVNNPDLEWTNAARKAARAKVRNGTAFAQPEHAATPEGYDVALKAWAKTKGIPIPANGKLSPSVRERFSNETGLLPPAHQEQATG